MLSFWTFSDVFEEGGPIARPFEGMFGLRAKGGINKPSYYAYGLLHRLGDERLANSSKDVIVTKVANGGLAIVVWNLVDPGEAGTTRDIDLTISHLPADAHVSIRRVDEDHGNALRQYAAMGSPLDPTPSQVEQLNRETAPVAAEATRLQGGSLRVRLMPNALELVEVQP
jgi:xylan 1,4-beta-xylosidase